MNNPSRTINKIRFDDISAERFEDMCLQLVYRMHPWVSIQHFGRTGKDKGVDIFTRQEASDGTLNWCIQCKRYKAITTKELETIIDDFIKKNAIPDKYLLIISCDVSRGKYEKFKQYAESKGLPDVDIVASSVLEAMLYSKHPDLLYTFFGVNLLGKRSATVVNLKRRLSTKKKMMKIFSGKKTGFNVIIRDLHRDSYPEIDEKLPGISPWFKLEYYRPYHKGFSFYIGIVAVAVNQTREWKILKANEEPSEGWSKVNTFVIGDIPYDNIADIDEDGDGFYPHPHLYCEFNNLGEPYERIWYMPVAPSYPTTVYPFDPDKQIKEEAD